MDFVMTNIPTGAIAAFLVELLVGDPSCAEKKGRGIDRAGLSLISVGPNCLQVMIIAARTMIGLAQAESA